MSLCHNRETNIIWGEWYQMCHPLHKDRCHYATAKRRTSHVENGTKCGIHYTKINVIVPQQRDEHHMGRMVPNVPSTTQRHMSLCHNKGTSITCGEWNQMCHPLHKDRCHCAITERRTSYGENGTKCAIHYTKTYVIVPQQRDEHYMWRMEPNVPSTTQR